MEKTNGIERSKESKQGLQPSGGSALSSSTQRSAKHESCHREHVGREAGVAGDDLGSERDIEEDRKEEKMFPVRRDDGGGVARPWVSSEDVFYFLIKVVVGNALMVLDFIVALR